ncbi:general substrate transporter [Plectosphaerella cucumerina]|uniref:General substrate transporter n=1 Tax=Plectosphaerella cucumerina TaxID=40658 RepID=A0A8K0TS99_9PEZI|nr:general substrate transporter [Plectosphaerella cucumerina]
MLVSFLTNHNKRVTQNVTRNLILSTFVLGLSVFTFGFETTVLSTTQAMTPFERKFGEWLPGQDRHGFTSAKLSYLNSLPLISYSLGVIFGAQVGEKWGRKLVLVTMNLVCIIGCLVCITSKSYSQMLVGRMIIYIHVGIEAWLVPMYQAEIVPAAVRGTFVAFYAFDHIFAGLISSIVTNFTSKIKDDNCWLIPFGLMFIWPVLTLLLAFLVPESPRWLVRQGRYEDAVKSLRYLNGAEADYPAEEEAKYLLEAVEEDNVKGNWSDMLKGTNRKRTLHGTIAAFLTQATGQSFASNYGTVFIKSIGVFDPFTATMIKRVLLVLGTAIVIFFVDKTGRRPMFFVAGTLTMLALMTMGGLGMVANPSRSVKEGIVAMSMMFPATYFPSFGANLLVVKSEICHVKLRDKSTMVFFTVSNLANFVVTFTLPFLLNEPAWLGSKVGFIFGGIALLGLFWAVFWMPELANKTLEDIDEMFEAGVPAWHTRDWKPTRHVEPSKLEDPDTTSEKDVADKNTRLVTSTI